MPVRFKVDENLPAEAAELLRRAGHDAVTVGEQSLSGSGDADLARICQTEARSLVTLDLGFADIRTYPPALYPGMLVLRLRQQDKPRVLETLGRVLPLLAEEPLDRRLWIVDERQVRVRE